MNYKKIRIDDTDIRIEGELFFPAEEQRAEAILKALKGMRIISAQMLLEKCKDALMQDMFQG